MVKYFIDLWLHCSVSTNLSSWLRRCLIWFACDSTNHTFWCVSNTSACFTYFRLRASHCDSFKVDRALILLVTNYRFSSCMTLITSPASLVIALWETLCQLILPAPSCKLLSSFSCSIELPSLACSLLSHGIEDLIALIIGMLEVRVLLPLNSWLRLWIYGWGFTWWHYHMVIIENKHTSKRRCGFSAFSESRATIES